MRTFLFHLVAALLVIAYVNLFAIWRAIGDVLGTGIRDSVPFILAVAALVLVAGLALWRRRAANPVSPGWLVAALLLAGVGFASTDPAFPAKRVHVIEYALLSFVLWFSIPADLRTGRTLLFVFLAGGAYGVHDEWLQGLHPDRTYGLPDMFVNLCGAGAGVLAVRGLFGGRHADADAWPGGYVALALGMLVIGVALFTVAGTGFRHDLVPYWTVLPLLAGALALALAAEAPSSAGDRRALRALVAICLFFAAYPVLIDVARLYFA